MNLVAAKMFLKRAADVNTRIGLGVGVFVRNEKGQVLLEKRSDCGLWGLPGGRIEAGESILEAALREVAEETGLSIQILRLIGVYSEPADRIVTYPDNGDVVHKIDVIVEAKAVSGEICLSCESEDLHYFDATNLPAEICPPARKPIQDYLAGIDGIIS